MGKRWLRMRFHPSSESRKRVKSTHGCFFRQYVRPYHPTMRYSNQIKNVGNRDLSRLCATWHAKNFSQRSCHPPLALLTLTLPSQSPLCTKLAQDDRPPHNLAHRNPRYAHDHPYPLRLNPSHHSRRSRLRPRCSQRNAPRSQRSGKIRPRIDQIHRSIRQILSPFPTLSSFRSYRRW